MNENENENKKDKKNEEDNENEYEDEKESENEYENYNDYENEDLSENKNGTENSNETEYINKNLVLSQDKNRFGGKLVGISIRKGYPCNNSRLFEKFLKDTNSSSLSMRMRLL